MKLTSRPKLAATVGAVVAGLLMVLVPRHEGVIPQTYRDPVGIITACAGHTGPELKMGQVFTAAECSEMLADDLVKHARGVQDCIKVPMSDGELAAYTSLTFNIGIRAFCGSTAARRLNAGDHAGACAAIEMWNQAGGKVLPGLVRRRAEERRLCEGRA